MAGIDLGDARILETKKPELLQRLCQVADTSNPAFQTPQFKAAMQDTRRGTFETLHDFLNGVEGVRQPFLSAEPPAEVVDKITSLFGHLGPEAIEAGMDIARRTRGGINDLFAETDTLLAGTGKSRGLSAEFPSSTRAAESYLREENFGRPTGIRPGDRIPMSAFAGTALEEALRTGKSVINNPKD